MRNFLSLLVEGCLLNVSNCHPEDARKEFGSDYDPSAHYFSVLLTINGRKYWSADVCADNAAWKALAKAADAGEMEVSNG